MRGEKDWGNAGILAATRSTADRLTNGGELSFKRHVVIDLDVQSSKYEMSKDSHKSLRPAILHLRSE